jgi:hypothetical protein
MIIFGECKKFRSLSDRNYFFLGVWATVINSKEGTSREDVMEGRGTGRRHRGDFREGRGNGRRDRGDLGRSGGMEGETVEILGSRGKGRRDREDFREG